MKLYYAPTTISIAVAITLHEAELPFEVQKVDFAAREQTGAAYRALNPKGRVPVLETDHGLLTETGAILDYIATLAPQKALVPGDAFAAARMRGVMYYLASTMHVNHAHGLRGARWADNPASFADMAAKAPETMTESCHYIEQHGLSGPLVMGTGLTLADPYLFVICSWLEGDAVDVAAFPKITAFRAAMEARASVQAVRAAGML